MSRTPQRALYLPTSPETTHADIHKALNAETQEAARAAKRAPGEPPALMDGLNGIPFSKTTLQTAKLSLMTELAHFLWTSGVSAIVPYSRYKLVGYHRDMIVVFQIQSARQSAYKGDGWEVTVDKLITVNNPPCVSQPTKSDIRMLRLLATEPKEWEKRADFRFRASIHKRLTGEALKPGKVR